MEVIRDFLGVVVLLQLEEGFILQDFIVHLLEVGVLVQVNRPF